MTMAIVRSDPNAVFPGHPNGFILTLSNCFVVEVLVMGVLVSVTALLFVYLGYVLIHPEKF